MKWAIRIFRVLLNVDIIFSVVFLTFVILDWYNPTMAFTSNDISTKLLIAFCVVTLVLSIVQLAHPFGRTGFASQAGANPPAAKTGPVSDVKAGPEKRAKSGAQSA